MGCIEPQFPFFLNQNRTYAVEGPPIEGLLALKWFVTLATLNRSWFLPPYPPEYTPNEHSSSVCVHTVHIPS